MLKNLLHVNLLNLEIYEAKIYYHKTHEIIKLIEPEKCDLIITMNITISLLRRVADKNTILYFVSCSGNPAKYVKQAYPIATNHLKLYRTPSKVIFSSANLSLSSWDEISIVVKRNLEVDFFVEKIRQNVKLKNDFVRKFY